MTDQNRPEEKQQFETDTVQANQAEQQGLGVGERELQAQRDPGQVSDVEQEDGDDAIDRDTAVQGQDQQAPNA